MRLIFGSVLVLFVGCVAFAADSPITVASTSPATMPTTGPTTGPAAISWDQARDHIGESVTVTGPVMGFHDFGGAVVLNIGKDFPDATRFTVYISAEHRKEMPADLDQGKTIAVTGKLKIFHKVPEIEGDAAHISIADASPTTAATQP